MNKNNLPVYIVSLALVLSGCSNSQSINNAGVGSSESKHRSIKPSPGGKIVSTVAVGSIYLALLGLIISSSSDK